MAFDREDKKAPQEMDADSVFAFDTSAISLVPSLNDQKGLGKMHQREKEEYRSGKIKQRMVEVIGREISPVEISQLFHFPEKEIAGQTLMCTGDHENDLEISTILQKQQKSGIEYAGIVNLAFRKHAYPYLFIRRRELETTGEQIGLEIQCRLEKLCRDNGIWKIHNEAKSRPANYLGEGNRQEVGAYVWARCGFEFERKVDAFNVMAKFSEYTIRNGIKPQKDFIGFGKAIDYAKMTGIDKEGKIISLGKDFFLNSWVIWHGVRDLRLDSPGTKIFVEYLKEKGRTDMIEKYLTT